VEVTVSIKCTLFKRLAMCVSMKHFGMFAKPILPWKTSKYYIFWVCVCSLVNQHAKCMSHIILSSVACLDVQYFSILSYKWHDFQKRVTEYKICVLIFPTTPSETFLILKRNQPYTIINVNRPSREVPIIPIRF
jgi:hypothetical protein